MKAWLAGLDARELNSVIMGGISALLLLVYLFVWQPLAEDLERSQTRVLEQRETAGWMNAAVKQIKSTPASKSASRIDGKGQSLLSLVDKTSKQFRLSKVIKRIEPDGENGVRVWIEKAEFKSVSNWLVVLQRQFHILVDTVNMDGREEKGLVNARIVLQRP